MANSHGEISSSPMKQFGLCLSWVRELIPQVMKLQVAMTHLHSPYSHVAEGELGVTQKGRHLRRLLPGDVFGELAVLYNCQRTATVMGKEGIVMCDCLSKFSAANVNSRVLSAMPLFIKRVPTTRAHQLLHFPTPLCLP